MSEKKKQNANYEYWRENIMDEHLEYLDSAEKYALYLQWKSQQN